MNGLISATALRTCPGSIEALRNKMIWTTKIVRKIKQFWVIAKFLQDIDSFQWLRVLATKQGLNIRRLNKQLIELELELGEIAEHDLLVLDRHFRKQRVRRKYGWETQIKYLQYLVSRSLVRRIINLETRPPSCLSFSSHLALAASVASASRPRIITFSKFFLKSSLVPR